MKYVTDTETTVVVAYKIKAIKADANALKKHLIAAEKKLEISYWGNFEVITDYIDFEECITAIEYDFAGQYSEKLINSMEEFINKQICIFKK